MQLPTLDDLQRATEVVRTVMPPTPQYTWPLLNHRAGTEVWVKHENHSPVGAFKLRGATVYMDSLKHSGPSVKGVIAATRGNHGQGVAHAAARLAIFAEGDTGMNGDLGDDHEHAHSGFDGDLPMSGPHPSIPAD